MHDGGGRTNRELPGPELLHALAPYLAESVEVVDVSGTVLHRLGPPGGVMGHGSRAGTSAFAFLHPDDLPRMLEFGARVTESGLGYTESLLVQLRHVDGSWRSCEILVENRLDDPTIAGIVIRTRELPVPPTETRTIADEAEAFAESIAEAVPMAMLVLDRWGHLEFANTAARALCALDSTAPRPRLVDLVEPDGREELAAALEALEGRAGTRSVRLSLVDRAGEVRAVEARLVARGIPRRPSAIIAVLDDITDRCREEAELRHRASVDPLTGLLNRTSLLDEIERRLQHGPVTAVFCDLDGFKAVNDTLGHATGDALLQRVARLLSAMTCADDAVGRFGGDEFVIVCHGLAAPATRSLIRRLNSAVFAQLGLRLSMGVSVAEPGTTAEALLARADRAMYDNKQQAGRSRRTIRLQ